MARRITGRSHGDPRTADTRAGVKDDYRPSRDEILRCLVAAWNGRREECPAAVIEQARLLAASRYERDDWNLER